MIAFTVLAVQVVLWQNQDLSVDIVSETETGNQEVTISIRNTAGSTLLFYENAEMTGKIEYLSESGWVEYCDVSYTLGNANAISRLYGGTFAELDPGEDWDLTIPEDKVANMQNGTYRIKMTYITEKNYNKYLENAYKNRNNSSESNSDDTSSPATKPDKKPNGNGNTIIDVNSDYTGNDISIDELVASGTVSESSDISEPEEFLAASSSEVFIKTFDIVVPDDLGQDISIVERKIGDNESSLPEKNDGLVSETK